MQNLTQYPELDDVLLQFVERLKPVLGDNLLAVYLQGSFALGGGDEDSDVDFLVVIEEDIPDKQLPGLEAVHLSMFEIDSYWSHHLEGSYFPRQWLKNIDYKPLVYIDNGSKKLERSNHDNKLVVRWVTREHGITLYGEEPETYIDPVPEHALKAEVKNVMASWGGDLLSGKELIDSIWLQAFAVIFFCRTLYTLKTGTIHSKPDSVAWGQSTLDPQWKTLITEAWQKRENQYAKAIESAHPDDVSRTLEFVEYALNLSDAGHP